MRYIVRSVANATPQIRPQSPPPVASDGVTFRIREARPEDVFALAALHVETFKQAHRHRRAPSYELRETQWRSRAAQEPRRGSFTADTAGGTCAVSLRRRRAVCRVRYARGPSRVSARVLGHSAAVAPNRASGANLRCGAADSLVGTSCKGELRPLRTLTALRAAAEAVSTCDDIPSGSRARPGAVVKILRPLAP